MHPTIMRDALLSQKGVFRMEILDAETLMAAVKQELSIKMISGGMRLDNIGIMQCAHRQFIGVMFCNSEFVRPKEVSMFIVDTRGTIVGREVISDEREALRADPNILWLSDEMVIFVDRISDLDTRFVMSAVDYAPEGMAEGLQAMIYYPSMSTAQMINRKFGVDDSNDDVWTVIVGIDGVFPESNPIPDFRDPALAAARARDIARIGACGRCGGGSRWTGPPW